MSRLNRSIRRRWKSVGAGLAIAALLAAGGSLLAGLALSPPAEVEIAGFATNLDGRMSSQRHNARLAAEAIDGKIIAPGAEFSFNKTVKSWSLDAGYVKAPVSYEGELIRAFGGGVCQTSTTLYNTALLAGLPILERHSHVFSAHYVPPGQDAAVAHPSVDLRFKNPYPWPIRIAASARGDRLSVRMFGSRRPSQLVQIVGDVLSTASPGHFTRTVSNSTLPDRRFVRTPGAMGCRVVTYRIFSVGGQEVRRERLSDDTYESMNRVTQIVDY